MEKKLVLKNKTLVFSKCRVKYDKVSEWKPELNEPRCPFCPKSVIPDSEWDTITNYDVYCGACDAIEISEEGIPDGCPLQDA